MTFKYVFIAVFLGTALVVSALLVNRARPQQETSQPSADFVRAAGKCVECHRRETSAIIHQYAKSQHAVHNVTCYDCHRPQPDQATMEHKGFTLAQHLTASNCRQCHATEYDQFVRSRHGAPAWAAVVGSDGFSEEQITFAET